MSHRTKSGQKRKRHEHKVRRMRRWKRQKAALVAAGKVTKGTAPTSAA